MKRARKSAGWKSAKKERYGGRVYASRSEAAYARHLDRLLERSEIEAWTPQVRVPLEVEGVVVCTMVPDFSVELKDGERILVEIKGYATPVWRLKRKLLEALYPDVTYIVIPARKVLSGEATNGVPAEADGAGGRSVARRKLRQRVRR